ncbi:MAG: hypothetical protein JWM32_1335 [Verrucomicrobia bacterium]|nr:hypothetical protein [Verrucomicrobiota bacterium]
MSDTLKTAYTSPAAAAPGAINFNAPDLNRHPPRSPRTRLGGYAHLPRLLDKARAVAAGKGGDYHYNCPFDKKFFDYTGIDHEAFMAEVKTGKSDSEILAYVQTKAQPKRDPSEIAGWSQWMEQWTVSSPETRAFFNDVHKKNAAQREDIATWFDWIELDDFVTFGGRP